MAMSKKDYQAIARAIYRARVSHGNVQGQSALNTVQAWIADAMAEDSNRFDRARFIEACETGSTKGMRKAPRHEEEVPLCARVMGCLCAFHARDGAADEPCNAVE